MIHDKPPLYLEANQSVGVRRFNQDTICKINELLKEATSAYKGCNYLKSHEYLKNVELLCLSLYNPLDNLSNASIILNLARVYLLKATLYQRQNYLKEASANVEISSSYLLKLSDQNQSSVLQRLRGGLEEIDTDIQLKKLPKTTETIAQAYQSYKNAERWFLYAQDFKGLQRINWKIAELGKMEESLTRVVNTQLHS